MSCDHQIMPMFYMKCEKYFYIQGIVNVTSNELINYNFVLIFFSMKTKNMKFLASW